MVVYYLKQSIHIGILHVYGNTNHASIRGINLEHCNIERKCLMTGNLKNYLNVALLDIDLTCSQPANWIYVHV